MPVRFGVLGCAEIAQRRTIPGLLAHPDIELVAVASRDANKAARFAAEFGCAAMTGYQRLLDDDDISAIYLPLPAMLHADWVERALLAGKHVLVEKPLGSSHFQAVELTELAREKRLVLLENMMFLQHSQHRRAAELLADGAIGELRSFSSTFTIPPKPPDDIRYQAAGGGALLDIGCYPVRTAMYFLGDDLTVDGAVLRHDRARGVVLSGAALLTNAAGVIAHLNFGLEHSYRSDYEFAGSTGRLVVDRAFTPPPSYAPVLRLHRQSGTDEIALPPEDQFQAMLNFFVAAVRGDEETSTSVAETVRLARMLDTIAIRAHTVYTRPGPYCEPGFN
ncbi:Gfo/Idh/MocA family protein [Nocardia sp. A7]|uniref:Gfo/Idh/MocA family protein n=1 Tax=Nocardia sp. A7 TaxID=2789274 RepID=UPI00397875FF